MKQRHWKRTVFVVLGYFLTVILVRWWEDEETVRIVISAQR